MQERKTLGIQSKKIQAIRGFAIIAVVIIHCTPDFSMPIEVFFRPFVNFAVGTFLFLSGMLSNVATWNPLKRIKKVLVPYIIWTLIYAVINYEIASGIKGFVILYIKYLLLGTGATMLYFVFVYCEFTLLIPAIDNLANSSNYMLGFAITPTEIILCRLLPVLIGETVNPYIKTIMRISCLGWFSYFYLGYLLGNNVIEINYPRRTLSIALVASIVFQMMEGYLYYRLGDVAPGTQLKLTTVLTGCIFCMIVFDYVVSYTRSISRLLHFLIKMGDSSFGIFFNHIAIIRLIQMVTSNDVQLFFLLKAIITIMLSFLTVKLIKRVFGTFSIYFAC